MRNMGKETELKDDVPELRFGLGLYLDAFYSLDTERSHSFGPVQIPWSKIQYFAEVNHFDDEQTENLHVFIAKMDGYELERVAKQQKRAAAKDKQAAKGKK